MIYNWSVQSLIYDHRSKKYVWKERQIAELYWAAVETGRTEKAHISEKVKEEPELNSVSQAPSVCFI